MAEYEKLEERLISGKGILRIPDAKQKMRHYILYGDMVRSATTAYGNFKWNPARGMLARLTFRRSGYAISHAEMINVRQSWEFVNDPVGQALIAIKCAYEGTLQSFANIAAAQGLTVISVIDLIKDYDNLATVWDSVTISCEADCAVQFRLYGMPYDSCKPEKDKSKKPPPPPAPLPRLPEGIPIGSISPPYNPNTNDGGFTRPNELDSPSAPPQPLPGEVCVLYSFDIFILDAGSPDPYYVSSWYAFGEVSLVVNPAANPSDVGNVGIRSRGLTASYNNPPSECNAGYGVSTVVASVGLISAEIRNFRQY